MFHIPSEHQPRHREQHSHGISWDEISQQWWCESHEPEGQVWGISGGLETWLANIISLRLLEKKYPITYAHELKTFVVHTSGLNVENGMVLFKRIPEGSPYVDLCDEEAFIMVNTARGTSKGTPRPR